MCGRLRQPRCFCGTTDATVAVVARYVNRQRVATVNDEWTDEYTNQGMHRPSHLLCIRDRLAGIGGIHEQVGGAGAALWHSDVFDAMGRLRLWLRTGGDGKSSGEMELEAFLVGCVENQGRHCYIEYDK